MFTEKGNFTGIGLSKDVEVIRLVHGEEGEPLDEEVVEGQTALVNVGQQTGVVDITVAWNMIVFSEG